MIVNDDHILEEKEGLEQQNTEARYVVQAGGSTDGEKMVAGEHEFGGWMLPQKQIRKLHNQSKKGQQSMEGDKTRKNRGQSNFHIAQSSKFAALANSDNNEILENDLEIIDGSQVAGFINGNKDQESTKEVHLLYEEKKQAALKNNKGAASPLMSQRSLGPKLDQNFKETKKQVGQVARMNLTKSGPSSSGTKLMSAKVSSPTNTSMEAALSLSPM